MTYIVHPVIAAGPVSSINNTNYLDIINHLDITEALLKMA